MSGAIVCVCLVAASSAALVALVYLADDDKPNSRSDGSSSPSMQMQQTTISKSIPELPSWARMSVTGVVEKPLAYCAKVVRDANSENKKFDVVMWGDSITEFLRSEHVNVWNTYFGNIQSALLGVVGTSVEELTWRMMDKEKLNNAPRCIVILNGIINLKFGRDGRENPAEHMDFLIGWIRAAMPSTKVVLMAVLPNASVSVSASNARYKDIAQKHGITFAECGLDLNPNDKNHFRDGTHPASSGYDRMLRCLKPIVHNLLK